MAVNERSGVASGLAYESFETAIVQSPLFNGSDQFHRHVERAGAASLLEGQVPARPGAAGAFKGRKAAFDERTQLSDLTQGRLTRAGVPVGNRRGGVHGYRGLSTGGDFKVGAREPL